MQLGNGLALAYHNAQLEASAFREEFDPESFEDLTLPKVDVIHKVSPLPLTSPPFFKKNEFTFLSTCLACRTHVKRMERPLEERFICGQSDHYNGV